MYLDYAEDQARRKSPMHMADWIKKLDAFLQFNERNILTHAGKVSKAIAEEHPTANTPGTKKTAASARPPSPSVTSTASSRMSRDWKPHRRRRTQPRGRPARMQGTKKKGRRER